VTPWLFCATIEPDFGRTRDEVMSFLEQRGIETRPFFIPIHQLPPYAGSAGSNACPETERLAATGINLPTFTGMSDDQIDRVCAALIAAQR
jgi:perosamine synthetase